MDTPINHAEIEGAFDAPRDLLESGQIPDSAELRRAADHLKLSERYAHEALERTQGSAVTGALSPLAVGLTVTDGVAFTTRGPAMAGWPWTQSGSDTR